MENVGKEANGVTRKQAEAALRDRLVKVEGRGWRRPAPLTLRDLGEQWQREEGARKKPATELRYNSIVARLYEHFDGVQVRDLRPRDVLTTSPRTSTDSRRHR